MDTDRALDLLRERLAELGELPPEYGTPEFREWHQKTERTLKRVFGPDHDFVGQFSDITFFSLSMSDDPSVERRAFGGGRTRAVALLKGAIYELEVLFEPTQFASAASVDPELWEHVRRLVESEQWAQVASQTAIFVESKVRQWAERQDSEIGEKLMTAVLGEKGEFPLGRPAAGPRRGGRRAGVAQAGDYFGRTVNVAARIAARAGEGQVLVSERVAESGPPPGVTFVELGELPLKGISRPVRVLEARHSR
jgi:Protein of unknown function (Hypoth_ymh)/Adenylate and Guanylate cyclase catalytic domain